MTLEELTCRLIKLEMEVALLKANQKTWPDSIVGSMSAFPEFSEAVRLGKEWRDSQKVENEDWSQ